jgi:hypothetical protein
MNRIPPLLTAARGSGKFFFIKSLAKLRRSVRSENKRMERMRDSFGKSDKGKKNRFKIMIGS